MTTMTRRIFPVLLAAAALAACEAEPEAERQPLNAPPAAAGEQVASTLPPEVQVQIDSGNAAYRAQQYEAALAHYRLAAERGPESAAPWFGISMAAGKMGNQALADSAQARVQQLNPAMAGAGHPMEGAAAPAGAQGAMPGGHPVTPAAPIEEGAALPPGHP